ncbi:phospholipase [Streptococcus merionis]|uniref:phospholipase n=1 Tax=Streptococcus merionis TaxID=400065 RepID=UPI0035128BDD
MKTLFKIFLAFICLIGLSIGNSIYAEENSENAEIVKSYLIADGERVYFNYDKATQDNVNDEVINMGLLIEEISYDYSSKTFTPDKYLRSGWEVHGNYCGPGHNGNNFTLPVTDVLDQGCQNHDRCYKWQLGLGGNCECNRQLVEYIKANRRWIPADVRWKADSIRVYFETFGLLTC